jgi:hypothetical protein
MENGYRQTLQALKDLYKDRKSVEEDNLKEIEKLKKEVSETLTSRVLFARPKTPIEISETPSQKNTDVKITNAAKVAAKESVQLRKNIELLVKKFKVLDSIVKDISKVVTKGGDADAQIKRITNILSSGGDAYKLLEAERETLPTLGSASKEAAKAVTSAALGVGAIAAGIALLMSPEIRNEVIGFFTGILKGLGVSTEKLGLLKGVIGAVIGALGGYFTYKAFANVVLAFNKMKELAQVIGVAGQTVADNDDAISRERAKIDAEKEKVRTASKGAKDDLTGAKKDLKRNKKLNFFQRLGVVKDKVAPKLIRLGKNFLRAIPGIGTVLGIGFIVYDLFDIGRDVFNFVRGAEEKDEAESTEQEDNAPASAMEENNQEDYTSPTQIPESKAAPAASAQASTPSPSVDVKVDEWYKESATSSPMQATPAATSELSTMETSLPEAATSVTSGQTINQMSKEAEAAETDLKMQSSDAGGTIIINSVNNIITQQEESSSIGSGYSLSVGRS